jgi:hypothetical protein
MNAVASLSVIRVTYSGGLNANVEAIGLIPQLRAATICRLESGEMFFFQNERFLGDRDAREKLSRALKAPGTSVELLSAESFRDLLDGLGLTGISQLLLQSALDEDDDNDDKN